MTVVPLRRGSLRVFTGGFGVDDQFMLVVHYRLDVIAAQGFPTVLDQGTRVWIS